MATYFEQIVSEIMVDSYFDKFKFRKRDSSLIQKTNFGKNIIELEHWNCLNIVLTIRPSYSIRFDILSKWFEKYSFKSISDQRDNGNFGFDGIMLGKQYMFEFKYYDASDEYKKELENLKTTIIECSQSVFYNYSSLEKAYINEIEPILKNEKKLPTHGADWFFENLTLCKILHPEYYDKLKHMFLKHAEYMMTYNEPNISIYYDKLNEILSYLENYDFPRELQKLQ